MAKVVDAQAVQPGVLGRWPPGASPEGDDSKRSALWGREDEGVRWGRRCQVSGQLRHDGAGEPDGAAIGEPGVRQGNIVYEVSEEVLAALTAAYEEAATGQLAT